MMGFIFNLPYTLIFTAFALISIPTKVKFSKKNYSLIVNVNSFWWAFAYLRRARAMTFGHLILLSPKIKPTDLAHELIHVKQFDRYPIIFPILYGYQLSLNGSKENKYEKEAYRLSDNG